MKKTFALSLMIIFSLTGAAFADGLPSYYPDQGFSRTGRVDALYKKERRVVIDDIPYPISNTVVVHSLSARNDSLARIRGGVRVAFRVGNGREIEEFWLLPGNYNPARPK